MPDSNGAQQQVRFGGRSAETERPKGRTRAAGRPYHLTHRQRAKLSTIKQTNEPLYRAYLLKEQLRAIYRVPTEHATALLNAWLAWARRSRLEPFVKLARTITDRRPAIEAAVEHRLSNARVEQVNTQLRLITRRAFGFHSPRRDRTRHAQPRRPLPIPTRQVTQPTEPAGDSDFFARRDPERTRKRPTKSHDARHWPAPGATSKPRSTKGSNRPLSRPET
jgi:hypothetical protein